MSKTFKGTMITIAATLCWGFSGISGQYLMAQGISVNLLTSLRLIIAGLVLTGLAFIKDKATLTSLMSSGSNRVRLLIFAICGLLANQYAYLQAIHYTNAGTATVLQYIAPVLVLAYVSLKGRTLPTFSESLSIFLAILGTFLIATHGHLASLAITPLGLFWGVLSAFTYTAYMIIPAKLIQSYGSLTIVGLGMLIGGLVFPIFTQAWRYRLPLNSLNLLALFGLIVVGAILAYTLFLKGISMVGPLQGSLLAAIEPVASVILAALILGQVFYQMDILGMLFIVLAVLIISLRDLIISRKKSL